MLEAPGRARRAMGQYPIPLVILARLAVDLDYQGQGLGSSLLQDAIRRTMAIAEQGGIQALLTHPSMPKLKRVIAVLVSSRH